LSSHCSLGYGMADLLNTFALVAATLTGFIGVVFVLGRRAEGQLSMHEASAVFHLLYAALGALFLSLVAGIFLIIAEEQVLIWRILNGVCGLYMLLGVGVGTAEEIQGKFGIPPKAIVWPLFISVYISIGVNFVLAAGHLLGLASLVFLLDIVLLLLVTTIMFLSLLIFLPTDRILRQLRKLHRCSPLTPSWEYRPAIDSHKRVQ